MKKRIVLIYGVILALCLCGCASSKRVENNINTQELPFDEIGKRFGLTGERIRQLKEKILKDLKTNYTDQLKRI